MIGWLLAVAYGLDLEEARSRAVEQAIMVQIQRARTEAASGAALEALGSNLPQIGARAQANTQSGPNPFGRFSATQAQVGVSATWSLIDPAQWSAAFAARRTLRGQRALLAWTEAMARRDATIAYAEALAAEEIRAARGEAADDARRAAEGVASLAEAGLRPQADRARAEATAEALDADRIAAEGEVAATCASLQALVGLPITGSCALEPVQTWEPASSSDEPHPALVAAEEAARAARESRRGSVLASVPTVTGTFDASQNQGTATVGDGDPRDLGGLSISAGVTAAVPVFGSGVRIGQLKQARAERDEADAALEDQRRALEVGRIGAEARYASAVAAVSARQRALRAAEEALQLVDGRYRQGLTDLEAWLAARRDRDDAQIALAVARADRGRALAVLESMRGVR